MTVLMLLGVFQADVQGASVGNCSTPSAAILSTPLDIASCQGKLEVIKDGIDQVYSRTSGPTIYMDGESYGYTEAYTGGSTGATGDWTYVSGVQLSSLSFRDTLSVVPSFAVGAQEVTVLQTVTYAAGNNLFDIRWEITNNTSTPINDLRVLHSCDSFVQGDDQGDYGELDWGTGSVGLRDDTPPPSLFQGLSAQKMLGDASVGAMHYHTANFPILFDQVRMGFLPDTIDVVTKDQAIALEYDKATPLLPGQTWTINHLWIFDFPAILFQVRVVTDCLPCGRVGEFYSWAFEGQGGTTPYTWSALGPLPGGLTLDPSTGVLSGTLTTPGVTNFDILLTDNNGISFIKNFTFDGDCQPTCVVRLCGDCDDSGDVNVLDAYIAVKSAAGLTASWTATGLANCNVYRPEDPDPMPVVSVLDGLWIAQYVVGLRPLDCCQQSAVQANLDCGETYCGSFDVGDSTCDLSDLATTHYLGVPAMAYGRGLRLVLDGAADVDLYIGQPGTAIGSQATSSYTISATTGGTSEVLVLDDTTTPAISTFWNQPIAIAVKGVQPGGYSLRVECTCLPVDITGTESYGGRAVGDTSTMGSDILFSGCGGMGSPERVYRYDITVPGTDVIISTDNPGTTDDTVLYILQGSCDSTSGSIGCDDNGGTGLTSTITLYDMPAGTMYIVVDSTGSGGPYELTVVETPSAGCPPLTLDGVIPPSGPWPYVIIDTTIGQDDSVTVNCGSGGGPDRIYSFTPLTTQAWDIDTCGAASNFDTILQIRETHCRIGATVACNDDNCGNRSGLPEVVLNAGTEYFIIVDGYSTVGDFELTIRPRVICSGGGTCSGTLEGVITSLTPAAGIYGDTSLPSLSDDTSGPLPAGCSLGGRYDDTYEFHPPLSGIRTYTIKLCDSATTYNAALAIRKCDCQTGAFLACDSNSCPAGAGAGDPSITISLDSTQTYYIVVDGYGSSRGPYRLHITSP